MKYMYTTCTSEFQFFMVKLHVRNLAAMVTYMYTYIVVIYIHVYTCVHGVYPDTAKNQSKPQVYKSDIHVAPCGQI